MLNDFSKALEEAARARRAAQRELNRKLGTPDAFVRDAEDPRFGTGYWKTKGGVFSYRRYANGYDPNSRVEYSDEFINLLNDVRG